jgi:glycosyltransferase involved in cell wall biosynthesis
MSIGEKRNRLNEMAQGKYVVQWDDDDWIHSNAINMIMKAIKEDKDCISFKVWADIQKEERWKVVYSIKYDNYNVKKNIEEKVLFLPPDQKCPMKKKILNNVKFLDIRYNEDKYFIRSVSKFIKNEHHIDDFIYESAYRGNEKDDILIRYGIKKTNNLI